MSALDFGLVVSPPGSYLDDGGDGDYGQTAWSFCDAETLRFDP